MVQFLARYHSGLVSSGSVNAVLIDAVRAFIIQDLRPLNVVEGKGFRQLMKVAELRFNLPSRTHFSRSVIPAKYVAAKRELEAFLGEIEHCSITTDIWTAKYQVRSYVSLTCHAIYSERQLKSTILCTRELPDEHTAENLSDALQEMMTEWKFCQRLLEAAQIMPGTLPMQRKLLGSLICLTLGTHFSYQYSTLSS